MTSLFPTVPDLNILVVDDHTLFRDGFKLLLDGLWEEPPHITAVGSAEQGLSLLASAQFDLIFLDLGLPGLQGMNSVRAFRRAAPATSLVVISAVINPDWVRQCLQSGVQGYIPKTVSANAMRTALRTILQGGISVPDGMQDAEPDRIQALLTARQQDVLTEIGAGRSNKEIADLLGMTENTVRVHVTAVLRQLGVRSRTEAALLAKSRGWS